MRTRKHYEQDDETFNAPAYTINEKWAKGVAWYVLGWETEPDEDTEWSGIENRTGRVVCKMVGDDSHFTFEPEDVIPLEREAYCGECGQIGCGHDGLDRSEAV
jgi:hypothetical protein